MLDSHPGFPPVVLIADSRALFWGPSGGLLSGGKYLGAIVYGSAYIVGQRLLPDFPSTGSRNSASPLTFIAKRLL